MPLDDLVQVIETLKQRITTYGHALNETQTRVALIDPLLSALGWDVSDPGIVTPEYRTDVGWADYALQAHGSKPAAVVEAKRLGSFVENHLDQMVGYCISQGIAYAAVTDGNHWQAYRTFEPVPLLEKRVLDVQIGSCPAFECALKLLLLWRPNLASGQPVEANHPITVLTLEDPQVVNGSNFQTSEPPKGDGWMRLSDLTSISKGMAPLAIWFPTGEERPCAYWWHVLSEVAEWLVRTEKLTAAKCPVKVSGVGGKKHIVHIAPEHSDGKPFWHPHQLSNSFYMEKPGMSSGKWTKTLLQHCDADAGTVWIKLN